jgi:hypothetical protein
MSVAELVWSNRVAATGGFESDTVQRKRHGEGRHQAIVQNQLGMDPGNTVLSHAAGSAFDGILVSTVYTSCIPCWLTLVWWLRSYPTGLLSFRPTDISALVHHRC